LALSLSDVKVYMNDFENYKRITEVSAKFFDRMMLKGLCGFIAPIQYPNGVRVMVSSNITMDNIDTELPILFYFVIPATEFSFDNIPAIEEKALRILAELQKPI
jgi:hypothetical protein